MPEIMNCSIPCRRIWSSPCRSTRSNGDDPTTGPSSRSSSTRRLFPSTKTSCRRRKTASSSNGLYSTRTGASVQWVSLFWYSPVRSNCTAGVLQDVDVYKTSLRDDIDSWLKTLAKARIQDWMIVLVETYDVKKSNKLLPRTTVLDKIRSDFASKHGDR